MQATTLDNLRRAKGPPGEMMPSASGITAPTSSGNGHSIDPKESGGRRRSSDLVSPKHMKKYITQLLHAKGVCERRLVELGADPASYGSFASSAATGSSSNSRNCNDRLPFDLIMNSAFTRRFFAKFLEEENQQDLLGCWSSIQELREADKTSWHQLATEIFYSFIHQKTASVLQVDRVFLKRIEAFLIGDAGEPEVFLELQERVRTVLKETYYPAFLTSAQCK